MCGRYYIDLTTEESVRAFVEMKNRQLGILRPQRVSPDRMSGAAAAPRELSGREASYGKAGAGAAASKGSSDKSLRGETLDIRPSDTALLITGDRGSLLTDRMHWGFPASRSGQLLINARAETALTKPTFSDSVQHRRCVIPAAGFYEWDAGKNKVTFNLPGTPYLFMAGFFRPYGEDLRFIILTTDANESMRPVHDRMPLILPESEVADWILDPGRTGEFLRRTSPQLSGRREYEQMTLPFI